MKEYRKGLAIGLCWGLASGVLISRLQTSTDMYLAWGLFTTASIAIYLSSIQWRKK